MAGRLQTDFGYQKNLNSIKLPNSKLYFYDSGTDTLSTIYADVALSVTQTNPVTADSNGDFNNIYLTAGNSIYKIVLKDEKGVTVWTSDNDQPSLNTTIIPLVPGEYDFIFWIESTPEIGSRLEFNGTNVPTLSEASISSNTAIESKTQTNLTVVSGQSYPLTNIDVTASSSGAVSNNGKVYFTYSGVDAAYKSTNVTQSYTPDANTLDTEAIASSSYPYHAAIDPQGIYVLTSAGTLYARKIVAGAFTSATISGGSSTGSRGSVLSNDYACCISNTSFDCYSRSGDTFTKQSISGFSLATPYRNITGTNTLSRVCVFSNTGVCKVFSRSGNTFTEMTMNGGSLASSAIDFSGDGTYFICGNNIYVYNAVDDDYDATYTTDTYGAGYRTAIMDDGSYFVSGSTGVTSNLELHKFNGSGYNRVHVVSTGDGVRTLSINSNGIVMASQHFYYIDVDNDELVFISTPQSKSVEFGVNDETNSYFVGGVASNSSPNVGTYLFETDNIYSYNFDVSSTISTEPDSGKIFASPSSATTSEFDCGDTATTITVKSKFSPTSVTVDGSTTSTSLVTDDSNIIQGDYVILSTDGLTPYYGQVGTTTVSVGGGKATYTSDITSIGIGSAPIDCFTGNIVAKSSVQSSSGSPSYTTDTYSSIDRDGVDFEITYTTRSVSGRYVQLQTEFDYIDSLDKFYAGLNR